MGKSSKIKISNKSANKRMKSGRKHKLNQSSNKPKNVNIPVNKWKNAGKERTKFGKQPVLDSDGEEDPEDFSDEEMSEFLNKNSGNLSFLQADLNSSVGSKKRKRNSENEVALYEKIPRSLSNLSQSNENANNRHDLLPFKTDKGLIQRTMEKSVTDLSGGVDNEEIETEPQVDETENQEPENLTLIEVLAKKQNEVNLNKLKIAQLSQEIVEYPEANINLLKQLIVLCGKDEVSSVRKLAVLSLLEVFKDIIPSYRIRELSDEEKSAKVSRDVRKLRDFEESLLTNYQKYLQILEENIKDALKLLKKRKKNGLSKFTEMSLKPLINMATISTKCLSQLLMDLPHFNFGTNIIAVLVPNLELHDDLLDAGNICNDAIRTMFKRDTTGDISLEIVKIIHKIVKSKPHVNPKLLEVLLSLRINIDAIRSASQRSNKIDRLKEKREAVNKMSKKERKRKKIETKLDKELQEAEAVENRGKIERTQTEIVKLLFVTYFRVLKTGQNSSLLSPVLKGLSKFAHLINVELFDDLMTCLQRLLELDDLGVTESLNCIYTALKILSGQGEALTIDPRQFYVELYNLLPRVCTGSNSVDTDLTKQCLDTMLIKRRKQVSLPQVLAYFKRLSTSLLHWENDNLYDVILMVRNILQLHKKCDYLLDNEAFGSGVFQQDVQDPERSNADSTVLWELSLLQKHYNPHMDVYSKHILNDAPSHGAGALPTELLHSRPRSTGDEDPEDLSMYLPKNIQENSIARANNATKVKIASPGLSELIQRSSVITDQLVRKFLKNGRP